MKPANFDVEDQMRTGLPVYQGSAIVKAGFIRKVYSILALQVRERGSPLAAAATPLAAPH